MRTKTITRKPREWGKGKKNKQKLKIRPDGKFDTWRPTKKTPEVLDKLKYALMRKCSEREACAYAWISVAVLEKRKTEDKKFIERIDYCKSLYLQAIKFASFERTQNLKNRDATEILMKMDKDFSDKVEVKWEVTLRDAIKAIKDKRLSSNMHNLVQPNNDDE